MWSWRAVIATTRKLGVPICPILGPGQTAIDLATLEEDGHDAAAVWAAVRRVTPRLVADVQHVSDRSHGLECSAKRVAKGSRGACGGRREARTCCRDRACRVDVRVLHVLVVLQIARVVNHLPSGNRNE